MDIVCESHCGLLGWPGCYESLIGQGRNDREVCDGVLLSFMEALIQLLEHSWTCTCHSWVLIQLLEHSWTCTRRQWMPWAIGPLDGDGSPLRWYGVCFGVAEQGEGPQGSVRRMGPFRARLLAGQTRSDAHGESATPSSASSSSFRAFTRQASSPRRSSPSHTAKVEVKLKMMVLQTRTRVQ